MPDHSFRVQSVFHPWLYNLLANKHLRCDRKAGPERSSLTVNERSPLIAGEIFICLLDIVPSYGYSSTRLWRDAIANARGRR